MGLPRSKTLLVLYLALANCDTVYDHCGRNLELDGVEEIRRVVAPSRSGEDIHGTWPWMVTSGFEKSTGEWSHQCGGALISPSHVLTAAHCVVEYPDLVLRFGDKSLTSTKDDGAVQIRKKYNIHIHPKFREGGRVTVYFDVAIWELEEPLVFNSFIRSVCLPDGPSTDISQYDGQLTTLTGWGVFTPGQVTTSDELRKTNVEIYPQSHCNDTHEEALLNRPDLRNKISTGLPELFQNNVLCAGNFGGGGGSCYGDSGSPLLKLCTYGCDYKKYFLIGIVQGGVDICGSKRIPSIYSRIDDPDVFSFVKDVLNGDSIPSGTTIDPKPSIKSLNATILPILKETLKEKLLAHELGSETVGLVLEITDLIIGLHEEIDQDMDGKGTTLMMISCKLALRENVDRLLKLKADPKRQNIDGQSALHWAAKRNLVDILKLLLAAGADPEVFDNSENLPIHLAIKMGHVESMKILATAKSTLNLVDDLGRTPLLEALTTDIPVENAKEMVQVLLRQRVNLNTVDREEHSAIFYACSDKYLEIFQLLILRGVNVDTLGPQGRSCLQQSYMNNQTLTFDFLLDNTNAALDLADANGATIHHHVSFNGDLASLERILAKGFPVDLNVPDDNGETAIFNVARNGNLPFIMKLVEHGADVNHQRVDGSTILSLAARYGHLEVVEYLMKIQTLDTTIQSNYGDTPLMMAVKANQLQAVQLILDHDPKSIEIPSKDGITPLVYAAQNGYASIATVLAHKSAEIEGRSSSS
ncbi:hypothetical protein TCAL_09629 [Tigriopus californicus]|uniref:Peptidase S1 domain-containing protein n=2 Tax=Tigriopus californicus TaxID=6832 RepID=A0A553NTQ3_TIGCA|nr:hypothetical protein TCAL_09629 [Tigriopus californicus]